MTALLPLFISFSVLIFDQISKVMARDLIEFGKSIPVVEGFLHLTLVFNKGAAFGMLRTQTLLFVIIGIIALAYMLFYLPRLSKEVIYVRVGFALVFGGILGNMVDRLRFGYVVDFIDFRIWPVFNIADIAITVGATLLIIHLSKNRI